MLIMIMVIKWQCDRDADDGAGDDTLLANGFGCFAFKYVFPRQSYL